MFSESDEDRDEYWLDLVRVTHDRLYRQKMGNRAQTREEIKSAWQKNLEEMHENISEDSDEDYDQPSSPSLTWGATSSDVQNVRKKMAKVTFADGSKQRIPITMMPAVTPLPRMNTWASTPRNLAVEDDLELCNIPFIDDKELDRKRTFADEVVEDYDGRIRGVGEKVHKDLFVDLVQALTNYQNDKEMNETPVSGASAMAEPCKAIFQAISEAFAGDGTAEEIREKYIATQKQIRPNIDGPDAKSFSCDETMDSYRTLFCRRCCIYDCFLHRGCNQYSDSKIKFEQPIKEVKPSKEPCGQTCFMLLGESEQSSTKENASAVQWNGSDESLFRVLYGTLPNDYCAISQLMQVKTCQEVFKFSQKDKPNLPSIEAEVADNEKSLQKRKKNIIPKPYENENVYIPCQHDGPCELQSCFCIQKNIFCEKFCGCRLDCPRRFVGCRCLKQCNKNSCPCYAAARECDPDLCKSCDSHQFDLNEVTCKNVGIQRGIHKHLLVAPSDVAGWGVFLKDGADKNELISEYCGELISSQEAERRGKIYDKHKCSFLFKLNNEFEIDATRKGNKMRFANHSKDPNSYPKVMFVNGDHRIGIYAKQDIKPGEEVFFDYRYKPDERVNFVNIERKSKK